MTDLGNCIAMLSASTYSVTGLGNLEIMLSASFKVTGLGKCGNLIGENLHGDWLWPW